MYENRVRPLSQLADVETLLRWHKLDPVDEAELRRNDLIEEHQGNRNPYIDNADLAVYPVHLRLVRFFLLFPGSRGAAPDRRSSGRA